MRTPNTLNQPSRREFLRSAAVFAAVAAMGRIARAAEAGVPPRTIHPYPNLAQSIPMLAWTANCAWSQDQAALGMKQCDGALMRAATASHLRKLVPAEGKFDRAGWNVFEMPAEVN